MLAPNRVAITKASAKAMRGGMPNQVIKTESNTLVKPTTAPTDKSMPPEIITNVAPTATIPRKELSVNRFVNTRTESIDGNCNTCLLYTSDAADDLLCVDLGGR